jgi:alkylation response protein AidB-like acyl-CoA dehydrogenase
VNPATAARETGRDAHEAGRAVETAREYLEHVTWWAAGRTSFGARLTDNAVIRQRLAQAIIAIAAADAALGQPGMAWPARCSAAVSSAARGVRACQDVHAAAGVFDPRPDVVHTIHLRQMRGARPTLEQMAPALEPAWLGLASQLQAMAGDPRQLVSELDRACPAVSATLTEEVDLAQALAGVLPPGVTARVLAHRNVVRTYPQPTPAFAPPAAGPGGLLTSIAVTEPQGGSDLACLLATIRADGPELVLDGTKTYVTGGMDCDAVLVAAKSAAGIQLAWVDARRPEVTRRPLPGLAWAGAAIAELTIRSYVLGERDLHAGNGTAALLAGLARERLLVAGQQLAYARRWMAALPPGHYPGLLCRMAAARGLLYAVVTAAGPDAPPLADSSMVKVECCALAVDVAAARAQLLAAAPDGPPVEELAADQASASAATFAGGTADLNLAIVEGKILSLLGTGNGG